MKCLLKSGCLMAEDGKVLARIRSSLRGQSRRITLEDGGVLRRDIVPVPGIEKLTGDARTHLYVMADESTGDVMAEASPLYAEENCPEEVGWPVCRAPKVDRALVMMGGEEYFLVMLNSQNYTLSDNEGEQVLGLCHNGVGGSWTVTCPGDFTSAEICAVFVFCRYIEVENDFPVV